MGRWSSTTERRTLEGLAGALDLALDYGAAFGLVVVATVPADTGDLAVRFPQRITLGPQAAGDRATPADVGTAAVGGAASRIRVHSIDDDEMSAIAAAFPRGPGSGRSQRTEPSPGEPPDETGTTAGAGAGEGRPDTDRGTRQGPDRITGPGLSPWSPPAEQWAP